MKILNVVLMFLLSMNVASAALFTAGDFTFTGLAVINNTDGTRTDTYGAGSISQITRGTEILWTSGDSGNYLNFDFSGYVGTPTDLTNESYTAVGGGVRFWLNDSVGVLDDGLSIEDQILAFQLGVLFLDTAQSGVTSGQTGFAADGKFTATGFLDVVGGAEMVQFDTNSLLNELGEITDLAFNMSASSYTNNNYDYAGSADLAGATVPLPATTWLMLSGLLGLLGVQRRRIINS